MTIERFRHFCVHTLSSFKDTLIITTSLTLCLAAATATAQTGYITTVLSNPNETSLSYPSGVAVDINGSFYVADTDNNVIWKVDAATGSPSIVAGVFGSAGNANGPLGTNKLNGPQGIAVDSSFNLYIADTGNNEVRLVNSSGASTLSAGFNQPTGITLDSTQTNAYVADAGNNVIKKVVIPSGSTSVVAGGGTAPCLGDGGSATSACLVGPVDVAIDSSGNLYIADTGHYRVREVIASTGTINTIAGSGTPGVTGDGGSALMADIYATGIALDNHNNVYVSSNSEVRKIAVSSGNISDIAGSATLGVGYSGDGGPATSAQIGGGTKQGIAFDPAGDLYIADQDNDVIREVAAVSQQFNPPFSPTSVFCSTTFTATVTNPLGPLTASGGYAELRSEKTSSSPPGLVQCVWRGFPDYVSTGMTLTIDDIEIYTASGSTTPSEGTVILFGATGGASASYSGPLNVSVPAGVNLQDIRIQATAKACNTDLSCYSDVQLSYIHIH